MCYASSVLILHILNSAQYVVYLSSQNVSGKQQNQQPETCPVRSMFRFITPHHPTNLHHHQTKETFEKGWPGPFSTMMVPVQVTRRHHHRLPELTSFQLVTALSQLWLATLERARSRCSPSPSPSNMLEHMAPFNLSKL